jgi:hypothetical protein
MQARPANPELSPYFRLTYLLISVVLIAGASVFFLPDIGPGWFWHPAPFNRHFVGAVYLTELAIAIVMLRTNRWAPARLVLPGSLTFSVLVSAMSIVYNDRLDPDNILKPIWYVLYFGSSLLFFLFWWQYHRLPQAMAQPVSKAWRYYLLAQGFLIGLYGLAQMALPEQASPFWPWSIDDFHGRFYSAVFLTLAVSSFVASGAAAPIEWMALGLAQITFGLFAILGMVTVDASLHRVNWAAGGTWVWTGAFVIMLSAGAAMLLKVRASHA